MPSSQTPNYSLSQWERTDKVLMEDFNEDNAKIDAALKAETDACTAAVASLAAQVAGKGNCQIWTTSYIGNGLSNEANTTQITFPGRPAFVMIVGDNGHIVTVPTANGSSAFHGGEGGRASVIFTWNGSSLSWYSNYTESHMNLRGVKYTVIAFYAKS